MKVSNSAATNDEKPSSDKTVASPLENSNSAEEIVSSQNIGGGKENGEKSQAKNCCAPSKLCRFFQIKINKTLLLLKFAMICWYSGSVAIITFCVVYLKQLGLSLDQLSIIFSITPFIQFLGPIVSGIISDKLGTSKPVFLGNLLIVFLASNAILFVPPVKITSCPERMIDCHTQATQNSSFTELCEIHGNESFGVSCIFNCSSELPIQENDICFQNYISKCDLLYLKGFHHNCAFSEYVSDEETTSKCAWERKEDNESTGNPLCSRHLINNCTCNCERGINSTRKSAQCASRLGETQLFILLQVLLILFYTPLTTIISIFDVTTMSLVKIHGSSYGRQYVCAIIACVVSPILTGYIIDLVSPQDGPPRYEVIFYLLDITAVVTALTVWKLDITIASPTKHLLKKTASLLKDKDIPAFICSVFVLGIGFSFRMLFSAWYLEELGASSILMGLSQGVSDVVGLPFIFTSNWFVQKFGSTNLMILALVAYFLRFIGYSFMINPWWVILYEISKLFAYHLLWVAVVAHSESIAPTGLKSTVISIAGGVHYCLGSGAASLIGGFMMNRFGGRTAFRVMAIICAVTAALYALHLFFSSRNRKKKQTP